MAYGEATNVGRISIGGGKLMEDLKNLKKKKKVVDNTYSMRFKEYVTVMLMI